MESATPGVELKADPGKILLVRYADGSTWHQVVVDEFGEVIDRQQRTRDL